MAKKSKKELCERRHLRLRQRVRGTAAMPRLCINRTLRHIHAQVIDDQQGHTLVAVSTVQPAVGGQLEGGHGSRQAARLVGAQIARVALDRGIAAVVFDRNGLQYHGAVKEFADAAREAGLKF